MKITNFAKKEYMETCICHLVYLSLQNSLIWWLSISAVNISIKYHIDANILDLILNTSCINYDLESLQLE